MEQITINLRGTSPLMMHSDRLANPLDPATILHKELTGKRKKTEADHLAIAKSEFIAGAYWSEKDGFFIPGPNLDATFLAGAKLQKLGTHWKRAALVLEDRAPLVYEGPTTPEKLWRDRSFVDVRGVRIGTSKIMRYRPIFMSWAARVTVSINPDILDLNEARKAIEDAGRIIGTCEHRPRFGRFEVTYA